MAMTEAVIVAAITKRHSNDLLQRPLDLPGIFCKVSAMLASVQFCCNWKRMLQSHGVPILLRHAFWN
jgi:hypothetical protein